MSKLCIYHLTAFGDHIIGYSIVKHYSLLYDKIVVFVRNHSLMHINNMVRLYSSLPNVKILSFDDHHSTRQYIRWNAQNEYLDFVHEDYEKYKSIHIDYPFDRYYYMYTNLPFEKKWEDFYFERNLEKEKDAYYNHFGLNDGEEFIFTHEDAPRNYRLDKSRLPKNIKIINFFDFQKVSILDTLYTIEKAKEVHLIPTGLVDYVDVMNIQHDSLNYHQYVRPVKYGLTYLHLNWNKII